MGPVRQGDARLRGAVLMVGHPGASGTCKVASCGAAFWSLCGPVASLASLRPNPFWGPRSLSAQRTLASWTPAAFAPQRTCPSDGDPGVPSAGLSGPHLPGLGLCSAPRPGARAEETPTAISSVRAPGPRWTSVFGAYFNTTHGDHVGWAPAVTTQADLRLPTATRDGREPGGPPSTGIAACPLHAFPMPLGTRLCREDQPQRYREGGEEGRTGDI